ncbi:MULTISPECIES: tetratricopeptide repeat protein [Catenuloplanes]|uniref:Negative regulator of RcsB-dependent stress response n=1 Tax=Catenuloplanes niger TaxID=587534 RepID=A0AAE3ZWH8_9ACTN|nr:hypothetical protein [Catenuloplanes niger]MDR7327061.1 putative negative regulator of RcsB-dependent stress response [Catenuloplanes niger]
MPDLRSPDSWLPAEVAAALVTHGRLADAYRYAERGDWHCARDVAAALVADGRVAQARELLRPIAARGHWAAVETLTGLLGPDEAITLLRGRSGPFVAPLLASLLAAAGRTDEVVALLGPHVADSGCAHALVALTAGTGRDEEVAALLRARLDAPPSHADPCELARRDVERLLATVLDRRGFVDEAVALLDRHPHHLDQLAGILARHDREGPLRALAAGPGGDRAACRLAHWLERHARPDEAAGVLRPFADEGSSHAGTALAALLARHGRVDEAIEVLRPFPTTTAEPEGIIDQLCDLLTSQGRVDEALALLDDTAADDGGPPPGVDEKRAEILARAGRAEQAIAELRARAELRHGAVAAVLASLLTGAGRVDEAVAVLRAAHPSPWTTTDLAVALIRQGRAAEGVALFHAGTAARQAAKHRADTAFWRDFAAGR